MMMLITILAATYVTIAAFATFGFGLLMRRTKSHVAEVWRAEEWRQSRAARQASQARPSGRELVGAGSPE